ncbi:MerR family DNA-binding transcriptional regulator [Streptomyces decoyicus]
MQELATRAGITSRTLRHYDRVGLLAPRASF